jgi:hypothetical protein
MKTTAPAILITLFLCLPLAAHAQERFDTQETVVVQKPKPKPKPQPTATPTGNPNVTRVSMRVGEIRPVLESKGSIFSPGPEAFYLPPEALGIVQLVVERKGSTTSYFLRALKKGTTAGGVVQRSWLDKEGFKPKSITDEGRIQQALRNKPWYITVQ